MPVKRAKSYTVQVDADGALSVADISKLFNVTDAAVRKWITAGCPVAKLGGSGRGNTTRMHVDAVHTWLMERDRADAAADGDDPQDYSEGRAKAKDWHYRALIRQAQAYEQIGALVPVDVICGVVAEEYQKVRAGILSISSRIATRIAAETDPAACARLIDREANRVLSNLSEAEQVADEAGADLDKSILQPIELDDIGEDPDADEEEAADA